MTMLLFLLGYILCFSEMSSLSNSFADAEILQNVSDFENKKNLKDIIKPPTKVIKTTHGDIYECVDFYKQSTFDHPSMKNHLFQYEMRQTSFLKTLRTNNVKFDYLWENGIGCPTGTVPIKRVTKKKLLRLNFFSDKYKPQGSWNFTYNIKDDNHHFAVSRTNGKIYNGATMTSNIYNPKVTFPQFSSTRIHIQIGNDFIQAGWTVNPKLYSDYQTRSFVYTKVGENQCYNSMCPVGIIMVRSDFPLGLVERSNVRGASDIYFETIGLLKDERNGNWWLEVAKEKVGFWPAKLFQQTSANNIEWGGEVYSASMPIPQMGCGYIPVGRVRYDSILCNLTLIDENFNVDDQVKNREAFSDIRGYKVVNDIYSDIPVNNIVYYGGPRHN